MVGKITKNYLISGSDIATLMNKNPYKSRNDLMAEKLAERGVEGFTKSTFAGNQATEWGNRLEPLILVEAAKMLGIEKYETEITKVYKYQEDFIEVSLDGIFFNDKKRIYASENIILENNEEYIDLEGNGCAEAKNTASPFTPTPPEHRGFLQGQTQCLCTKFKWFVVATLYQGNRLTLYIYKASEKIQNDIISETVTFYNKLKGPDWFPALDGPDAARTYATGEPDLPEINLESNREIVEEFVETKKAIKALKDLESLLEAQIMDTMGNHTIAFLNHEKTNEKEVEISWPMRKTKATKEKIIPAKPEKNERQKTLSIAQRWLK
tara:strand:- start:342 stop:1313 length:972 start_codon:yes stop_codon:yes gene_type:complete